jgi:hypothetical protein
MIAGRITTEILWKNQDFHLSISFHRPSSYSYIVCGMNNRPTVGRSSEVLSYRVDMNNMRQFQHSITRLFNALRLSIWQTNIFINIFNNSCKYTVFVRLIAYFIVSVKNCNRRPWMPPTLEWTAKNVTFDISECFLEDYRTVPCKIIFIPKCNIFCNQDWIA